MIDDGVDDKMVNMRIIMEDKSSLHICGELWRRDGAIEVAAAAIGAAIRCRSLNDDDLINNDNNNKG